MARKRNQFLENQRLIKKIREELRAPQPPVKPKKPRKNYYQINKNFVIQELGLKPASDGKFYRTQIVKKRGKNTPVQTKQVLISSQEIQKIATQLRKIKKDHGEDLYNVQIRQLQSSIRTGQGTSEHGAKIPQGMLQQVRSKVNQLKNSLDAYITHLQNQLDYLSLPQHQQDVLQRALDKVDSVIDVNDIEQYSTDPNHHWQDGECYLVRLFNAAGLLSQSDINQFPQCMLDGGRI